MAKIIIGIHGLGNKPPESLFRNWLKKSMREGLKRRGYSSGLIPFELVYWAKQLYVRPLNLAEKDKRDPYFLPDPYTVGPTDRTFAGAPSELRLKILDYLDEQLDNLFLNEDYSINYASVSDYIIQRFFRDLRIYYREEISDTDGHKPREIICNQLADLLRKHRKKEILLFAHSMGSIIAYDVLRHYAADISIDTLVTLGSPLGFPVIKSRIALDRLYEAPLDYRFQVPPNITGHWYNLADPEDKVAINYKLADDFSANEKGIEIVDLIVDNDFEVNGHRNPHKIYGYLRTPQMADIINEFLGRKKTNRLLKFMHSLFSR